MHGRTVHSGAVLGSLYKFGLPVSCTLLKKSRSKATFNFKHISFCNDIVVLTEHEPLSFVRKKVVSE